MVLLVCVCVLMRADVERSVFRVDAKVSINVCANMHIHLLYCVQANVSTVWLRSLITAESQNSPHRPAAPALPTEMKDGSFLEGYAS